MSKVIATTTPGRRTLSEKPSTHNIGDQLTALGKPWEYKKGETTKRGKEAEEDMAGVVVKGKTKFVLDFGELAEDLAGVEAKRLKAAGIELKKAEEGRVTVSIDMPTTSLGIADGKYFVK